jgi:hypothetical protein
VPDFLITTFFLVAPDDDPSFSIAVTTSIPSTTSPVNRFIKLSCLITYQKKLTEDDVSTIEPRGNDSGDEKLRAVGVLSSIGHGEKTRLRVLELEVLI